MELAFSAFGNAVVFSMSKANGANDTEPKESAMSFHKIVPVKKQHKPAPAAPKKPAPKKPAAKRRPVGHQH